MSDDSIKNNVSELMNMWTSGPSDDEPGMPETVIVGPYEYEISVGFLSPHNAETIHHKQVIRISDDLAGQYERSTVLHEVLHALLHSVGISQELGYEDDEKLVQRLESPLFELLNDNPVLVEFLTGRRFA